MLESLHEVLDGQNNVTFVVVLNHLEWLNDFVNAGWKTYTDIHDMDDFHYLIQNNVAFDGVVIRNSLATNDDVDVIKSKNKKVILFDIRAPKPIRQALKKQPHGIIVDDVKAALIEKSN